MIEFMFWLLFKCVWVFSNETDQAMNQHINDCVEMAVAKYPNASSYRKMADEVQCKVYHCILL